MNFEHIFILNKMGLKKKAHALDVLMTNKLF